MFKSIVFCAVFLVIGGHGLSLTQSLDGFDAYVNQFGKSYESATARLLASNHYIVNRNHLALHNVQADLGRSTYREAINQYSDLTLHQIVDLFPKAVNNTPSRATTPAATTETPGDSYDIIIAKDLTVTVENQGTYCSSSWAYATAKAVQIRSAFSGTAVDKTPPDLSAQELIDCAGMGIGCTTQSSRAAFNYLLDHYLAPVSTYPNNNALRTQDVCMTSEITGTLQLASYATIADGDDTSLRLFVANNIPVVVEYNPDTFGFMEYSSGVYVPSRKVKFVGSQFLVVVGYGHDADLNLDYWRCLNSFGTTWGESGYIRIVRSSQYPLTKNAIYPYL